MAFYVLRKLAFFLAAVFVASVAIFLLIRAAGGNVAAIVLGKDATAEAIEALVKSYGLDRPPIVQYFDWIAKMFQGAGSDQWLKDLRGSFQKVSIRKPGASRPESREVYVVAKGFKGA